MSSLLTLGYNRTVACSFITLQLLALIEAWDGRAHSVPFAYTFTLQALAGLGTEIAVITVSTIYMDQQHSWCASESPY